MIASTFPLGKSIFDLARRGEIDPISIVVLLGISADAVALLRGAPRLLLVRESLFTGAFGLTCFVSLLLSRPMMFYFARHFVAGVDQQRLIVLIYHVFASAVLIISSIHVIAKTKSPVRDIQGLILTPEMTIAEAPEFDVLLVPGGYGQQELMNDEKCFP